jgi:membrane-bound lytic murein transglycosylase A
VSRARSRRAPLAAAVAILCGSCRTATPPATGTALEDTGSLATLRKAAGESLAWLQTEPPDRRFAAGTREVTAADLGRGLTAFLADLADDPAADLLAARVRRDFDPIEIAPDATGQARVLVTAYFDPVIDGSAAPDPCCPVPVYAPPPDLELAGPGLYWDRHAIRREGRLAGRGLEVGWARDESDLFFLEVQGSGRLRLAGGSTIGLGFAASNGHPYRSIGRLLVAEGAIGPGRVTMQSIRAWLRAHPEHVERVLDANPRVVFFRRSDGDRAGAKGSLGRPLVGGRSVATDPAVIPPGALLFLDTTWPELGPDGVVGAGGPLRRFVLSHDSGSAIRGPERVDLYLGGGDRAGAVAGRMQQRGRLFLLLPR